MLVYLYLLFFSVSLAFIVFYLLDYYAKNRSKKDIYNNNAAKKDESNTNQSLFYSVFSKWAIFFKHRKAVTYRSYLEEKFVQAAIEKKYSPEIFWSFQIFMSLAFVALYLFLSFYLNIFGFEFLPMNWLYGLIALVLGFLYPLFWLTQKVKTRKSEVLLLFPDFVSTLALSVEAGLDYFGAMVRYVENSEKQALRYEIEKIVSDVRLGSSREIALKDFAKRIQSQAVQNFVAVLVQATQLGTSIGTVLKAQTEKLRRERFEKAERAGAIAAQKILFPLVFFIMPSVFLLIFGPLIVKLVTGGFNNLFL